VAFGEINVFTIDAQAHSLVMWLGKGSDRTFKQLAMPGATEVVSVTVDQGNGVCAVLSPDGAQEDVFAIGSDGTLWWWTRPRDANWTGPIRMNEDGPAVSRGLPAATWQSPENLVVFTSDEFSKLRRWDWFKGSRLWTSQALGGTDPGTLDVRRPYAISTVTRGARIDVFAPAERIARHRFVELLHFPGLGIEADSTQVNWAGNETVRPLAVLKPATLRDVVDVVKEAELRGLRARAAGTLWSFTDVALCGDYMIRTEELASRIDGITTHDVLSPATVSYLDAHPNRHLVHVEAGIKLRALSEILDRDYPGGWALPTMGGSAGQALAGAVSNGVHGGDLDRPPVADMVRAIHLVGPGAKQYWIEPTNGLTDAGRLGPRLAELGVSPENIIQDNDWFHSVLVSMGCMGVVYSYVVEVVDQYGLRDQIRRLSWEGSLRELVKARAPELFSQNRYVEILINPNREPNGTHTCYLNTRTEVAPPFPATPPAPPWSLQPIIDLAGRLLGQFTKNPRDATPGDILALLLNQLMDTGGAGQFYQIEAALLATFRPEAIKLDKSWLVMASAADDVAPFKSLSIEVVFDATAGTHLDFLDRAFALVDGMLAGGKGIGGTFSLRFTPQTSAHLGIQRFPFNCHVEIDLLRGLKNNVEALRRFEELAYNLGGITHWGMFQELSNADGVVSRYYGPGRARAARAPSTCGVACATSSRKMGGIAHSTMSSRGAAA
jgi:hypothetical protein